MNIRQFEEVLWNRDGVRVVIRAPTWANIPSHQLRRTRLTKE
jgi:hypothetical protein